MAEKVNGGWIATNNVDDYLGDKHAGVWTFQTESAAKSAAKTAGPNWVAKRIRLNTGDVKK